MVAREIRIRLNRPFGMRMMRSGLFLSVSLILICTGGLASDRGGTLPKGVQPAAERRSTVQPPVPAEFPEHATLFEYQTWAEAHNPELAAAAERIRAARERIPQARSLPDPQIGYTMEDMRISGDMFRHRVDVSQMFPWFGKRGLMEEEARAEVEIAEQRYEQMRLNIRSMVAEGYADYYYLSRSVLVIEENLRLLSSIEDVVRAAYAAGKAPQSSVIRAQVELGMLEEQLQSSRDVLTPAAAKLNALLNRPPGDPLSLPETLPDQEITLSEEELLRRIVDRNPDLQVMRLETRKEGASVKLAEKQRRPDVMLGIGVGNTGMTMDKAYSVMGMISVNLPVRKARNRAAVVEAEAMKRAIEHDRGGRENTLAAELKSALFSWRDANRKVRLYRDTLIPKTQQALGVSRRAFEAGMADFLDLIDVQRTLLELELALERSLADRVQEYAFIAELTGSDDPGGSRP